MTLVASRWDALCRRDAAAQFVFAVTTTGVACRPGCPARLPRRENVRFFDDFAAAQAEGFRPCKRCAPQDASFDAERQRLVARACRLIGSSAPFSLEEVASAVGLSRFHFQRLFRKTVGITPGDYRRACREHRFRGALAAGATVTEAIYGAGYGSASRAYEAKALGMTPSCLRAGACDERITYAIADSSLGRVLVARSNRGICAIELGDDDCSVVSALRRDFPRAALERDETGLTHNLVSAVALVEGDPSPTSLNVDIRGTAFQRRVWHALRRIPAGERWSYQKLAAAIGRPGAGRAVAAACAANRLAVAVPCHRAVGAGGRLKGYRWGGERKAKLLEREASLVTGAATVPRGAAASGLLVAP